MKKIRIITLLAVAAAVWMSPRTARAETFRLTIGAGHPVPAASWVAPMQSFLQVEVKKRVEQKTAWLPSLMQGTRGGKGR